MFPSSGTFTNQTHERRAATSKECNVTTSITNITYPVKKTPLQKAAMRTTFELPITKLPSLVHPFLNPISYPVTCIFRHAALCK